MLNTEAKSSVVTGNSKPSLSRMRQESLLLTRRPRQSTLEAGGQKINSAQLIELAEYGLDGKQTKARKPLALVIATLLLLVAGILYLNRPIKGRQTENYE
ncbi:MAG: hypothetical protein VYC39_09185 [Myxococcota bacterium]|nr:hypothetical protein [Myxococcota bacterium]